MAMDEQEQNDLRDAMEEPDISVGDTSVTPGGRVEVSEESNTEDISQVKQERDQYKEFAANVYGYTKADPENPDKRIWDIDKIVSEVGYDPTKLVRLGQENEGIGEEDIMSSNGKDDVAPKDETPQQMEERIMKKVLAQFEERLKPIQETTQQVNASRMLNAVMSRHADFNDYQQDIARMVQKRQPRDETELEEYYFAAKGRAAVADTGSKGGNLSSRGDSTVRSNQPGKDPDEEIIASMHHAGVKPAKSETMVELFGKEFITPLGDSY